MFGREICGGSKNFARIFSNLPDNLCAGNVFPLNALFWRSHNNKKLNFFVWPPKKEKVFMCFFRRNKSNLDVFRQSVSFITQWEQRCLCTKFPEFCPDFRQIKTFWGLSPPVHPPPIPLVSVISAFQICLTFCESGWSRKFSNPRQTPDFRTICSPLKASSTSGRTSSQPWAFPAFNVMSHDFNVISVACSDRVSPQT